MKKLLLLAVFSLILLSCARVGSPVGGDKDTIPPNFLGSNIDTPRVLVPQDFRELRLAFDEYITLKDVNKNLIISPPIRRIKKILPANLATREVIIQWEDTLQANTTYSFNFGNAIQDNNEGNPLPYFTYAFSTGEKIDDLYISGEITDGYQIRPPSKPASIVIGLYQVKDTMDYRQKPYYITRADDDGYYELNYISPGEFRVIAFEDENGNSVYDPGKEKVAFRKEPVKVDSSISGLNMKLFPSRKPLKYLEMKPMDGGVVMLFEGNPESVQVKSVSEKLKNYKVTHRPNSDSVKIWFNAAAQNIGVNATENVRLSYDTGSRQDTVSLFYKHNEKTEMLIENRGGNLLPPKSPFRISSNFMIDKIQPEKWTLTLDSLTVEPFTAKISETNPYQILVEANFQEGQKYRLTVPSKTVSSFYESTSKPMRFDFEADQLQNFGSITFQLANKPESKFWLQLLNSNEEVAYSKYTDQANVKFDIVKPEEYFVRILVDNNENGLWEGADFQKEIFAEDAYIFYKKISARPLWEIVEPWDLTDPRKLDPQKPAAPAAQQNPATPRTTTPRNTNQPLQTTPQQRPQLQRR